MAEQDSGPHLSNLSRDDIKKLEKMAQKAKRDEEAKTAKRNASFAAVGNTVSFAAPVRVSNDDNERKRLMSVLGRYEDMSSVIMSGKTAELMGVERQPSTPLPGKKTKNVFPNLDRQARPITAKPSHELPSHKSDPQKEASSKETSSNSKPHNVTKPPHVESKQKPSVQSHNTHNIHNHSTDPNPHRSDHSRSESARTHKPSKPSVQTTHPKTEHSDQRHSMKKPTQSREPVLQELGKELTNHTKPGARVVSGRPQTSAKVTESTDTPGDQISVLQVKEDNRNSPMVNGRVRHRPRIQIPEKNVEEMLKELTQVPQPLTAIQTPLKDIKFPYQENKGINKDQASRDNSREGGSKTKPSLEVPSMEPRKSGNRVIEDIQEKDETSDESGDDDDEEEDNDDDGESSGNNSSSNESEEEEEVEEGEIKSDNSQLDRPDGKDNVAVEPPPPQAAPQGSVSLAGGSSMPMPVKGQRDRMSSSESSGSDSDSSEGSASESESDEHEPEPVVEKQTTPKAKMSPDSMDPSPSRQNWALKSFFTPEPQLINFPNKPSSCEAPASDKSDPDHFDEVTDVKRSADNISDENIPSVGHEGASKVMSADEFSPPAPVDKCVLSPIKSPQPVKSPVKRRSSAMDKPLAAKGIESRSPYQHSTIDIKHKERKGSSLAASPSVSVSGSGRARKSKPKTPVLVESSSCESESEPEVNWSHSSDSIDKSVSVSPKKSRTVRAKRDKLIKEKDCVKLKKRSLPLDASTKSTSCDRTMYNSASAQSRPQESIEKMLGSFPEETPLSPIPNVPNINIQKADLKMAGLDVSPVKPIVPLNGLVQYVNGKPSIIVKLDLNLFQKYLPVDSWRSKPHKPKGSHTPSDSESVKGRKVKESVPSGITSHKVLDSSFNKESVESSSKHNRNSASDRRTHFSVISSPVKSNALEGSKSDRGVPSFDSLPIREAPVHRSHLSEESSTDGSSSDSEVEETRSRSSVSQLSASQKSKKRKGDRDDLSTDDLKRRKTLVKSPSKQPDVHKNYEETPQWEAEDTKQQRGGRKVKRERHSSSSSQHSCHSYTSTHSRASTASHKARRTAGPCPAPQDPASQPRPPSQAATALSPAKHVSTINKVIKSEVPEPVNENGVAGQSSVQTPCPDSTTSINRTDEVQHPAEFYHHQAKIFKYQADKLDSGLQKHLTYIDSILCFVQCGHAMEKEQPVEKASGMFKDTLKLVLHLNHQFRGYSDPESPELKLNVICLRIQSLVNLKLYLLKKRETLKLKKALEDHNNKTMKSSQQPKPRSAPSPLQTSWNRSTGTPSPMSPTPSPASVGSVGSVGSDHNTPSKISSGSGGTAAPMAPSGSVIVPQRIHSITQKYFAYTHYLVQAHELWEQADLAIASDIKEFFAQLNMECGPLTLHSSLPHLVKYVKTAINRLR